MAPLLIASPYPDGHVIVTPGREGGIRIGAGKARGDGDHAVFRQRMETIFLRGRLDMALHWPAGVSN